MDISRLTLGEIAKVEEIAGQTINSLSDNEKPKGKLLIGLAYVIKRRENPKFSMLEAEALTMDDISEILGLTEEEEDLKK
jgi:hypothetical protein